jgi:hypothetical protein
LALWKRSKTSRTSAGVQGLETLGFETLGFETTVFDGFDFLLDFLAPRAGLIGVFAAFLSPCLGSFLDPFLDPFLGTDRTGAFLARWARMIFAMDGIY